MAKILPTIIVRLVVISTGVGLIFAHLKANGGIVFMMIGITFIHLAVMTIIIDLSHIKRLSFLKNKYIWWVLGLGAIFLILATAVIGILSSFGLIQ